MLGILDNDNSGDEANSPIIGYWWQRPEALAEVESCWKSKALPAIQEANAYIYDFVINACPIAVMPPNVSDGGSYPIVKFAVPDQTFIDALKEHLDWQSFIGAELSNACGQPVMTAFTLRPTVREFAEQQPKSVDVAFPNTEAMCNDPACYSCNQRRAILLHENRYKAIVQIAGIRELSDEQMIALTSMDDKLIASVARFASQYDTVGGRKLNQIGQG